MTDPAEPRGASGPPPATDGNGATVAPPRPSRTDTLAQAVAALDERLSGGWHADRILKTGLAVSVAWAIGQQLGASLPIFAALAALQSVRPTIVESLRQTGGQIVGMVLGSLMAAGAIAAFGATTTLVVGLSAVVALVVTVALHATRFVGVEIATTTLFVIWYSARDQSQTATDRVWEAALGGAVAIVINAVLWPPDYTRDVHRCVGALIDTIVAQANTAVGNLLHPPTPERAHDDYHAARESVRQAGNLARDMKRIPESLRFSPLVAHLPWTRERVESSVRIASSIDYLVLALEHARAAVWSAFQCCRLAPPAPVAGGEWDTALARIADALKRFEVHLHTGTDAARQDALDALDDARAAHGPLLGLMIAAQPRSWEAGQNALVAELGYLLDCLAMALDDPSVDLLPKPDRPPTP